MKKNAMRLTIVVALILTLIPAATPLGVAADEWDDPYVSMVLSEGEAAALGLELLSVKEEEDGDGVKAEYGYTLPSPPEDLFPFGWPAGDRMNLRVRLGLSGRHHTKGYLNLENEVSRTKAQGWEHCRYPDCKGNSDMSTYQSPCYSLPAIGKGYTCFGWREWAFARYHGVIKGETAFVQGNVLVDISTEKVRYSTSKWEFQACKSKHDEFVSAISAKVGAGYPGRPMSLTVSTHKKTYSPGEWVRIQGTVSDANGPLSGVSVTVEVSGGLCNDLKGASDLSGRFIFDFAIPPDVDLVDYPIVATAWRSDYADASSTTSLSLKPPQQVEVNAYFTQDSGGGAVRSNTIDFLSDVDFLRVNLLVRVQKTGESRGYGGCNVRYEVIDVTPGDLRDFCAGNVWSPPWHGEATTFDTGLASFSNNMSPTTMMHEIQDKRGLDPTTFAVDMKFKVIVSPPSSRKDEDWQVERTVTLHLGVAPPELAVAVWLSKDDKGIQAHFEQYTREPRPCAKCKLTLYPVYQVPLTGTVTHDLPIGMTLKMRKFGQLAIDCKEKTEVTLGHLPFGIQEHSYNFSICPTVMLNNTIPISILLYRDMATEATAQALRMVFQAVGAKKFANAATLGTLFYDIANKVRKTAYQPGKQQVSFWDFIGLALTEIGNRKADIAAKLGKAGVSFAKTPFTVIGLVLDSGLWAYSCYNTPSESEEIWTLELTDTVKR